MYPEEMPQSGFILYALLKNKYILFISLHGNTKAIKCSENKQRGQQPDKWYFH